MTLPESGQISLSQVNTELGKTSNVALATVVESTNQIVTLEAEVKALRG